MEKITYKTTDGVEISGDYWTSAGDQAIILLHMMPATKESWKGLAAKLSAIGFQVLAIDLRGHGESTGGNYTQFSDEQHQASINDVEGAKEFLVSKGLKVENIMVGGASIGANLAIEYLARHHESPAGFALSPGLNYKGIEADEFIKEMRASQRVLLVAAGDDSYAAESIQKLGAITPAQKIVKLYPEGGHGTDLLESQPELTQELVDFLKM